MKYLRTSLLILTLIFTATSCRQVENPESVLVKFVNHLALREYEEAKQYATESTIEIIEMTALFDSMGLYPADDDVQLISEKDVTCNVSGSTAICSFPEYDEIVQVNLVLENNNWLIDLQMGMPDDFDYEQFEQFEDEDADTIPGLL
jgi:hypothetical protein